MIYLPVIFLQSFKSVWWGEALRSAGREDSSLHEQFHQHKVKRVFVCACVCSAGQGKTERSVNTERKSKQLMSLLMSAAWWVQPWRLGSDRTLWISPRRTWPIKQVSDKPSHSGSYVIRKVAFSFISHLLINWETEQTFMNYIIHSTHTRLWLNVLPLQSPKRISWRARRVWKSSRLELGR